MISQIWIFTTVSLICLPKKNVAVALQCSDAGALELVQHLYQIFFRIYMNFIFCFIVLYSDVQSLIALEHIVSQDVIWKILLIDAAQVKKCVVSIIVESKCL